MIQTSLYDLPPAPSRDGQRALMIGHSNHSWPRFAELLEGNGVQLLVDVRTNPRSRFTPHFNAKAMLASLRQIGILYQHAPQLGGKDPLPLREQRLYISQNLPLQPGTCFMCSEGDYRQCHRHYTLAPLFLELGIPVSQILTDGSRADDHGPTQATLDKMRAFLPPK